MDLNVSIDIPQHEFKNDLRAYIHSISMTIDTGRSSFVMNQFVSTDDCYNQNDEWIESPYSITAFMESMKNDLDDVSVLPWIMTNNHSIPLVPSMIMDMNDDSIPSIALALDDDLWMELHLSI